MKTKYKITLIAIFITLIGLVVYNLRGQKLQIVKRYYPDSKQTFSFEYYIRNSDTILQGKSVVYNKKGVKICEGNFVNNVPKGRWITYYDNGKIRCISYSIARKRDAESLWYYPNGEIEKYAFFSKHKEPIFLISYDEKGPIKYEGPTIEPIYQGKLNSKKQSNIKNDQHCKVGDTILHQYLIANIPQAKRSFKIENIGIDNTKVKRKITSKLPTTVEVTEVLTIKGKNTIRAVVKYEFKDNIMPAINDTILFNVEVH